MNYDFASCSLRTRKNKLLLPIPERLRFSTATHARNLDLLWIADRKSVFRLRRLRDRSVDVRRTIGRPHYLRVQMQKSRARGEVTLRMPGSYQPSAMDDSCLLTIFLPAFDGDIFLAKVADCSDERACQASVCDKRYVMVDGCPPNLISVGQFTPAMILGNIND